MSESNCEKFASRVNLRVAEITSVERHPQADKLYIETITLGDEERTIVSGLVPYYSADELLGKKIIIVANLKPAKLRGVESNGMLLAAESGGIVEVISVDQAKPGEPITLEGFDDIKTEFPESISIDEFFEIPVKVKNNNLYVDDKMLMTSAGPVNTEKVKDGNVT